MMTFIDLSNTYIGHVYSASVKYRSFRPLTEIIIWEELQTLTIKNSGGTDYNKELYLNISELLWTEGTTNV